MMVPVGRLIILREVPKITTGGCPGLAHHPGPDRAPGGAALGGFITTYFDWRWIFWMNIPIGIFGLIVATRYLPEMPPEPVLASGFPWLPAFGARAFVAGVWLYDHRAVTCCPSTGSFFLSVLARCAWRFMCAMRPLQKTRSLT